MRRVLIYGAGRMAKAARITLITAGTEISTVSVHDITITGKRAEAVFIDDLSVPVGVAATHPQTILKHGPERKGRGGKTRRW